MKKILYFAEVGVELDNTDNEYENYEVHVKGVIDEKKGLFDENKAAFFTLDEAQKFVKSYVKDGVPTTYGMIWDAGYFNLEEEDIKDIRGHGWADLLEDEYYPRDGSIPVIFFYQKLKNETILEVK